MKDIIELAIEIYMDGFAAGIKLAKEHPDDIRLITPKEN